MPTSYRQPTLLVIPSIDIKDGNCVRVVQGIPKLAEANYPNDPVEMAIIWRAENAKCLHVVDFDGAWHGSKKNLKIIENLIKSVVIPIQFGGGLRTYERIRDAFDMGVYRVVLGSAAVNDPDLIQKSVSQFGSQKVLVSLDVLNNRVLIGGRKEQSALSPISLSLNLKVLGITRLVVTDVERNGLMLGPNLDLLTQIAKTSGLKITASGGVSGYEDLTKLQKLQEIGVDSVIIGRALYENKFACQRLWRVAEFGTII
ncbi:MAG: 1-(5-phosphoribosyl)-5-[(5-phosphoribosylamino)methylideneamino]imidazole-4-carboxamide isomerase [Ignavibacteria bacterium]|nr:1-(5-phosphoribosyl)-5-[(5-phosphoribosylamino)methylideneamino]imidazole-4-carboxamide isomerase [Ignavibacteria bacterium]